MKKIVLATVLAALGSASALAADLGPRAYTKAPVMAAPVSTWQGFYIGGNVGYGWGDGNTGIGFLPTPDLFLVQNASLNNKPKGVIGGVQAGYNWQMGSLVTGFEADIQGSGINKGNAGPITAISLPSGLPFIPSSLTSRQELSWFGTVRGRLGAALTPDLLLYGTGGLAYGEIKATGHAFFPADIPDFFHPSVSKIKAGWTAGAGAEWMFARNWSAKAEYLFVDLGKVSDVVLSNPPFGVGFTWKMHENIVRAGVNYHF
jgi:outer membrane immunogenic protein